MGLLIEKVQPVNEMYISLGRQTRMAQKEQNAQVEQVMQGHDYVLNRGDKDIKRVVYDERARLVDTYDRVKGATIDYRA